MSTGAQRTAVWPAERVFATVTVMQLVPRDFFLERYADAYRAELEAFVTALGKRRPMPVGAADGRQALVLAEAALRSLKSGKAEKIRRA